ncbi:MAG: hypothetical protein ABGZ17_07980 [Planctomycetaceae bacterium]
MKFLDDTELVDLSTPHIRRLFVILDRGRVLWPIVAVTAVVCGVVAVQRWEITDSAARWGMDSLRMLQTESAPDVVTETDDIGPQLLNYPPPLARWLNAFSMWLLSPMTHLGLVLPCCAAYVGLVGATFLLYGQWCGPRYGFLAGMMVACHGPILVEATDPSPVGLCLCLAVFSVWSLGAHLQNPVRVFSGWLALSGVCWGLCLLAGGLFAFVPMLTALIGVGWQSSRGEGCRHSSSAKGARYTAFPIAVLIAALVVSGIFVVPVTGVDAASSWWSFLSVGDNLEPRFDLSAGARVMLSDAVTSTLGLSGLAVVGLVCVLRSGFIPVTSVGRDGVRWIVSWLSVSLVCWLYGLATVGPDTPLTDMCRLSCVLGLVGCAVVCFEEAALCRIHPLVLSSCVVFSSGVLFWTGTWSHSRSLANSQHGVILVHVVAVVLSVVVLATATRGQERQRRRWVLSTLLLVQIAGNASVGLSMTVHRNQLVPSLASQLRKMPVVSDGILISVKPPPDRLSFALRTLVANRHITHCKSWVEATDAMERVINHAPGPSTVLVADWGVSDGFPLDSSQSKFRILRQTTPEQVAGRWLQVTVGTGAERVGSGD